MDYSIPGEILQAGAPVFSHTVDGMPVWVKKRRPPENIVGWHIQRAIYRLTGMLLALPPDRPPENNVAFEADRLRQVAGLGFRVPRILHEDENHFVMSDVGLTLELIIRRNPDQALRYVEMALRELRALHDRGLAHGGAQIKNITVLDGEICFIDLEENIPGDKVRLFQLRDLFLFLLSLERSGTRFDLRHICGIYGREQVDEVLLWVVKSIRQLRAVRFFKWRLFSRFSMGDIRGICRLLDKADGVNLGTI